MAEVPRKALCSFPCSALPETLLPAELQALQRAQSTLSSLLQDTTHSPWGQGPVSQPLPEPLDGALPADRALGLVLHLLGHGHPVQHRQPHHGLRLQVGPLQELGRLNGRLPITLGRKRLLRAGTMVGCRSRATSAACPQHSQGPCPRTHKAEAAADAGLHVAAPEGCHLPQLPRDLDGLVEQDTEVPLVTQSPGVGHLAEEICGHHRHTAGTPAPGRHGVTPAPPAESSKTRAVIK